MHTLVQLWRNQEGFVISSELILIATVCVIAIGVGMKDVSRSIDQQTVNTASSFDAMPSSYRYAMLSGTSGATFADTQNTTLTTNQP